MKLTIDRKTDNTLLGRTEVTATVAFEGMMPKRYDVLQSMAAQLKSKPELVVIVRIAGKYGQQAAAVTAHAYKERKQLEMIEGKHMIKRNAAPEKPAEVEAPAEKPAEAPAEKAEAPAEKAEAPAEKAEAPADKPAEAAEGNAPAEKPEEKPAEKPAEEKPAEKKE